MEKIVYRIIIVISTFISFVLLLCFLFIPRFHVDFYCIVEEEIQEYKEAIYLFYEDNGRFPTEEEGLKVVRKYLKKKIKLKDHWGYLYIYINPGADGNDFGVFSISADGIEGTDDDIVSWENEQINGTR